MHVFTVYIKIDIQMQSMSLQKKGNRKNEENETGKLQIADWALIGKNDDFIAYLDQQLLMDTDERVNGVLSSISTASGKEIEIKLPYPLIYMDKEKEIDRNMPYKIAVTKYPSRKYIQFG